MNKLELITRNLQEVIGESELRELLKSKKDISVYWGTMPTGSISVAYFFPMLKIADFLKAGLKVKILIADLHAALDGVSREVLDYRTKYYQEAIKTMLKTIKVDTTKLEFISGSSIQLNKNYFDDLLKLSTYTSSKIAKKSAAETIKLGENPRLSGLIYPLMQALDEEYLKVDLQFGGMDQRKIMVFSREYLPKLGYKPRIQLINPLIGGLTGDKMSSSVENSKVDILDKEKIVVKKINKSKCISGDPKNGVMDILKNLIFVMKEDHKEKFVIKRPEKYGGDMKYSSYDEIEKDFKNKKIHPLDLKNSVAYEINLLLAKLRKNKKLNDLHSKAY